MTGGTSAVRDAGWRREGVELSRLAIESVSAAQLVRDLVTNHPEPWHRRDAFDPTYGAKELRDAARKGWIELETDPDPALWRFRLTPAGRTEGGPE